MAKFGLLVGSNENRSYGPQGVGGRKLVMVAENVSVVGSNGRSNRWECETGWECCQCGAGIDHDDNNGRPWRVPVADEGERRIL